MVMHQDCRIEIDSCLPAGVREELDRRFGPVEIRDDPDGTVLRAAALDQAGVRALLGLLWDAGLRINAMTTTPGIHQPGALRRSP
jgi:hypothetical protein